jgi:hypothetical protein
VRTVERLVDRWFEAHPEFADVRHLEDDPAGRHEQEGPSTVPEPALAGAITRASAPSMGV